MSRKTIATPWPRIGPGSSASAPRWHGCGQRGWREGKQVIPKHECSHEKVAQGIAARSSATGSCLARTWPTDILPKLESGGDYIARTTPLAGKWERLITEKRSRDADLISAHVAQKSKSTPTNPKGAGRTAGGVSAAARDLGITRDAGFPGEEDRRHAPGNRTTRRCGTEGVTAPISPDNCVVASNDRVAPIVKKTSAPAAQRFGALLRRI